MVYVERLTDGTIAKRLEGVGGVLITGPKACGKTFSAQQFAKSSVNMETDERVGLVAQISPSIFLRGDTPHLIDEWQVMPEIWNHVRHAIDERQLKGQFILTGSLTPEDTAMMHSGAGRISRVTMRTLSWFELGFSSGEIGLGSLLGSADAVGFDSQESDVSIDEIAHRLVVGGWPANLGVDEQQASRNNRDYIDLIANVDVSKVANVRRDPYRVMHMIESYARNIATSAKITSLTKDANNSGDDVTLTRETTAIYRAELERLMVIEDLPAWNTHVRSSAKLRVTPKRHLTDPSLAIAALGLDSETLIEELNYMGFVFESAVVHDLRIYAELNDATVSYYLDSDNDEVDVIVEKRGGSWAAFEIKLGFKGADAGAESLLRFYSKLAPSVQAKMQSLNVITGFGLAHTRFDGVNVIPFGLLGV